MTGSQAAAAQTSNGDQNSPSADATLNADRGVSGLWPAVSHLIGDSTLDCITSHRAENAATASIAPEVVSALKNDGYCGLPVPTEYGGSGASLLECCAVQYRLAGADPGLAIGLNMHLFSAGVMVEHWRRKRDTTWMLLEAVATQQRLIASAFAEPSLGGDLRSAITVAERIDGGYRVNGKKYPVSIAAESDLVCFQAKCDDLVIVGLVPTTADGISIGGGWRSLGMAGAGSRELRFDDCEIPDDLVFLDSDDNQEVFDAGLRWFLLTTVSSYLGAARTLLRSTIEACAERTVPSGGRRLDQPAVAEQIGQAAASLYQMEAACIASASADDDELSSSPDRLSPVMGAIALRATLADQLPTVATRLLTIGGAASYSEHEPTARIWQDLHACVFHPPVPVAANRAVGAFLGGDSKPSLGLEANR